MTDRSHLTRGYSIALVSAVFLSTTAIFIRYLTQTFAIPPLVLAFWRDLFVLLTLLPVLSSIRPALLKIARGGLGYLAGYGLVLAFFNILWTLSVTLNGAAVATVLVYCSAGFTALLGRWILKEQLGINRLFAIVICLGGCVLVSGALDPTAWNTNLGGILAGLLSGLAYAIYSLMGRSASQRGLNPWTTLIYTFGFAAAYLLLINLIPDSPFPGSAARPAELFWLGRKWVGWGVLFLLGAIPTVAGFGLYNVSLSYLPSSVANLVVTAEPLFTTIIAYILLGERLNLTQISGGLLILAGVIFLRISEGRSNITFTRWERAK
jgi:drug/metabolite transporter (DMT)-like permease